MGDVVLYRPPEGESSTTLSTIAQWDKPYMLVTHERTQCCIAQVLSVKEC